MEKLFFSLLLFCASFGWSNSTNYSSVNCVPPIQLNVVAQSQNAISFDWNDSALAETAFAVYYTKDGQTSSVYQTHKSEISFSNLPAGTYRFYFYTLCAAGTTSSIIIEDVMIG